MSDRYIPRINNFLLNILAEPGISTPRENEISVHEIPFSNRNILTPTGYRTQEIPFTCVFQVNPPTSEGQQSVAGVLPTYNNHFAFLQLLESNVLLEFVHPTYGSMDGYVKYFETIRRDEIDYVEIDITFLREESELVTSFEFSVDENTADQFRQGSISAMANVGSAIQDNNSSSFRGRLNRYINDLNSFFNNITSPVDSIINTVDYVEDLSGDVVSAINGAVDRMVTSLLTTSEDPSSFINNAITNARLLRSDFEEASGAATLESIIFNNLSAARIGYEAALQYIDDNAEREKFLKNIGKRTFDNNGRYLGTVETISVMSINALEQTSQDLRLYIDEAIQNDRDNNSIALIAREIQQYVDEVKIQRDKIITVTTDLTSLYALMHKYRISYQRIDENLALNPDVENPNFIEGDIRLLVPQNA